MSYCRWSSDDFQCDIYAYDANGGITIHVARGRRVFAEPLPQKMDWDSNRIKEWLARDREVMRIVEISPIEEINLEYAGESFYGLDSEEAVAIMEKLRSIGYRFPDYVIEAMAEDCS